MQKIDRLGWADGICFTSYGLRIGIRVNESELLARLPDHLPPGWKPANSPVVDRLYSLRAATTGRSTAVRNFNLLYAGAARLVRTRELEDVFEPLESDLQMFVAEWARRRIFVHAGVVGWRGQAIVIPGTSYSGKSTLVAALVRAGATYYSDEYAVFDAQGRVHPYARKLSLRSEEPGSPERCEPETLGGRRGARPLPVGLVALSLYKAGARWRPRRLSPGQAALALLGNTVPARHRPDAVFAALHPSVTHAVALRGRRGEADETAAALLRTLDQVLDQ
jgi:hypothetical protein